MATKSTFDIDIYVPLNSEGKVSEQFLNDLAKLKINFFIEKYWEYPKDPKAKFYKLHIDLNGLNSKTQVVEQILLNLKKQKIELEKEYKKIAPPIDTTKLMNQRNNPIKKDSTLKIR